MITKRMDITIPAETSCSLGSSFVRLEMNIPIETPKMSRQTNSLNQFKIFLTVLFIYKF
jgi:hypothetical protein